MPFPLSPSEAAEQSTGARFAHLAVQPEHSLNVAQIHGFRTAISELHIDSDVMVQLQLAYNRPENKGLVASVDLTNFALPDFRFMNLANDEHPFTVFMLGVTGDTAARIREIICSCSAVLDPNEERRLKELKE